MSTAPAERDSETEAALSARIRALEAELARLREGGGRPPPDADLVRPGVARPREPSLLQTTPVAEGAFHGHVVTRRRHFLKYVGARDRGLEIGPFCNPTVLKREAPVRYLDFFAREELIRQHPDVPPEQVAPVDAVVRGESYAAACPGPFDYIVANHVMEHVADVIGWLVGLNAMLAEDGFLFLTVPDRAYSFDHYRAPTPFTHLVADHFRGGASSLREHALDAGFFYDPGQATPRPALLARLTRADLHRMYHEDTHVGTHTHVFDSATMLSRVLAPILHLGYAPFDLVEYRTAAGNHGEILTVLRKRPSTLPVDAERLFAASG